MVRGVTIVRSHIESILRQGALEIRGDGRAGSGILFTLQCVAAVAVNLPEMQVQEWPFFSSARKGAPTRGFLRLSLAPIHKASEVAAPHIVIVMDQGVTHMVDVAQGTCRDGLFIMNTPEEPAAIAKKYRLSGQVYTIAGDHISAEFMKSPMGNIPVFALLTELLPGFTPELARTELQKLLVKRRLPSDIVKSNCVVFDASLGKAKSGVFDFALPGDHVAPKFHGYGELAPGAQSRLRLSRGNLTSAYARSGFSLRFEDPNTNCIGCGLCIINCPENIIEFVQDSRRGLRVTGADISNYCKLCRECIAICPKQLFLEAPIV